MCLKDEKRPACRTCKQSVFYLFLRDFFRWFGSNSRLIRETTNRLVRIMQSSIKPVAQTQRINNRIAIVPVIGTIFKSRSGTTYMASAHSAANAAANSANSPPRIQFSGKQMRSSTNRDTKPVASTHSVDTWF